MNSYRRNYISLKIIVYLILILIGISIIFPLYIVIISSFKTSKELIFNPAGLPQFPSFNNYILAITKSDIITNFLHTVLLSVSSTILVLLLASFTSFAIAKLKIKIGKIKINNFLYFLFLSGFLIPVFIAVTPLIIILTKFNLLSNVFIVILIYTAFGLPFAIFILTGFFKQIPDELIEASKIDGCNSFDILIRIVIPLSKSSLGAVSIIHLLWIWNDFLFPLIFLRGEFKTLVYGMYIFRNMYTTNWGPIFAYVLIQVTPIIVLYLFLQRFFISGIMAGAIKG